MTADELTGEMLALLRREFFAGLSEKQFFQERNLLLQAITWPARWLNERGARMPGTRYRAILMTVIGTIKRHGKRAKIERFSAYFLHSVQEHMKHHGDEYYYAAKEVPRISAVMPRVIQKLQPIREPSGDLVSRLEEVHRTLRGKGGRRPEKNAAAQPDLFGQSGR